MNALDLILHKRRDREPLASDEFAVWCLYNTVRYSDPTSAEKTIQVCEQAAAQIAAKDAALANVLEELDNLDGWQEWVSSGAGYHSGFIELLKVAKNAHAAALSGGVMQ